MTAPEGANLFRVQNKDTKHEHKVNTEKHTCTCDYFIEHKQPCRHMCVVFHETRRLGDSPENTMATFQQFWPSWALSTSLSVYCKKSVKRPTILPGAFTGGDADRILPPAQRKPKGRPRKKRIARNPTKRSRQEGRIINPWYNSHVARPIPSPNDNNRDQPQKRMRDSGV